jgi:hypothetical protein
MPNRTTLANTSIKTITDYGNRETLLTYLQEILLLALNTNSLLDCPILFFNHFASKLPILNFRRDFENLLQM